MASCTAQIHFLGLTGAGSFKLSNTNSCNCRFSAALFSASGDFSAGHPISRSSGDGLLSVRRCSLAARRFRALPHCVAQKADPSVSVHSQSSNGASS
ncbi:hypothetical protein CRG98_050447, partial [Punica granatum]